MCQFGGPLQIKAVVAGFGQNKEIPPVVCVVPVRMQEAWLLSDESAIRSAAGNPKGIMQLHLPQRSEWERLADPKARLYDALRRAADRPPHRRFKPEQTVHRVTEYTGSFAQLRGLSAFDALEEDVRKAVIENHWDRWP